jgi:hypothetical protein
MSNTTATIISLLHEEAARTAERILQAEPNINQDNRINWHCQLLTHPVVPYLIVSSIIEEWRSSLASR